MSSLQVLPNKAVTIILDRAFYSTATHALACVHSLLFPLLHVEKVPFPRATKEIGDVCTQTTHALATLEWVSLEKRRFQGRCIYVYKLLNGFDEHDMNFKRQ